MDYKEYVKSQVSEEDWKKLQKLDVVLDSVIYAKLWPRYVDLEKRRTTEVPFLLSHLSEYASPVIFNAALGSGATTIGFNLAGIDDVVSNELDENYAQVAQEEAQKYGISLNQTAYDWRAIPHEYDQAFDAAVCLGNSLTCLFKREDQLAALKNFRRILKPNGKLIIDERNYEQILNKTEFKHSGHVVYCGDDVSVSFVDRSDSMIVVEYKTTDGLKAHYPVYPFKRGELESLLREAGFREITPFGDYKPDFKPEETEFITYVCRK